ncbi:hypothetical protein LJC24_01020 [Desulfococcaceae bacterium OttesenSCG-928-F15]|nr:hypothetical protein [Desulfococcaceae bacterium OttesenSCG-928-F15]
MKTPVICSKCGSRNCRLESLMGGGAGNIFTNLLDKILPGSNTLPGRIRPGHYKYVCKDCGEEGMIIID